MWALVLPHESYRLENNEGVVRVSMRHTNTASYVYWVNGHMLNTRQLRFHFFESYWVVSGSQGRFVFRNPCSISQIFHKFSATWLSFLNTKRCFVGIPLGRVMWMQCAVGACNKLGYRGRVDCDFWVLPCDLDTNIQWMNRAIITNNCFWIAEIRSFNVLTFKSILSNIDNEAQSS